VSYILIYMNPLRQTYNLLITANKSKSSGALYQDEQSNYDNLFVEPQAYLDEFFGKIKGAGVLLAPRNAHVSRLTKILDCLY